MLLVLNSYLWKSSCFIILLTGAWYIVDHLAPILRQLYAHLKYVFAVPPADNQQSTWPGESSWPTDDD